MWRLIAALCFSIGLVMPAAAADGDDMRMGLNFKRMCVGAENITYQNAFCLGYVRGIADMMIEGGYGCWPSEVRTRQLAAVLEGYLNNNPQLLHLDILDLTRAALSQAFPCTKTK